MHEKLQELINYTADKFNLTAFHLQRHHFFIEKNAINEVTYILNMEWYPNDEIEIEEDLNPPGTISIDIDFHTKEIRSIMFVEEINQLDTPLPVAGDTETAIEWIEQESGLEFGRQFKRMNHEGPDLTFHAAADNIAVFPSGYIQMDFNEEGKLCMYSIHGTFPEESKINWEPFNLTNKQTEDVIRKQCTTFEIPVVDADKWLNVYGISTSFMTNDGQRIISFEEAESDLSYTQLQETLEWDSMSSKEFPTQKIDISTETTLEVALNNDQITSSKPIMEADQERAITMVRAYLQSILPNDSGKWKVNTLRREGSYLFAELKSASGDTRIIQRKITVVLDGDTLDPVNHVDNEALLETFNGLAEAQPTKLTRDEAFEILYKYVEVTPVFIYDKVTDAYILCGKIDSEYVVDAQTGELMTYDDLN